MKTSNWNSIPVDDFWQVADDLQERALQSAESLFALAEEANPKEFISLLIQYRFFTIYYTTDLAILIARLTEGRLRSFLGELLFDELGRGNPLEAHPRLYDDFLRSIGVTDQDLDSLAMSANIGLLNAVRKSLSDSNTSTTYGVGLRGMGGECVCQVYLARLYEHMMKNPYIQHRRSVIDWRFWDLHVGPHDIEHRNKTREIIHDEIVVQGPEALADLGRGYNESMVSWTTFWTNILDSTVSARVRRVAV
ncbi:iron-containing redox enzyme family protein [Archangium sp.]|uniref:iron-containing redox enzyme family protein n=1 Tax=Archangium sp. TaxID=1872627 RepID=UPI002D5AF2D3|nr:iron-containing redox enzyme family protein [Archangium sp.]HYO55267.1 iron-containing redox enzyme family protein [Archangium sp.]